MSSDELLFSILQELKHLRVEIRRNNNTNIDNWIDSHDLSKKLHVSSRTLQRMRKNGTLKFSKVQGKIFYRLEDVLQMLSEKISN